jgi:enoyl-[acyl-carrier protein] reductase I
MSYSLLKGKRGIIFGALDPNSIAWKVAVRAHEEGAAFTLTNAPVALRMGAINQLAEQCGAQVIGADATSMTDLEISLINPRKCLVVKLTLYCIL